MEATELRIGNIVRYDDNPPYSIQDGVDIDAAGIYRPIPLTEDWLLKFDWYEKRHHRFVFRDIEYYSIDTEGSLHFKDQYTCTDIKYVHQLQNLYFALTGEELTIKQS